VLPLPEVKTLQATQVRFGRSLPSRHNTSAPDIASAASTTPPAERSESGGSH
jgi:hypothetical protein